MGVTALVAGCGRPVPRPGVVLVVVDTLRADRLAAYGGRRGLTPVLDRLARESILFPAAQAQSPWTLPSIGSILTGMIPTALWEPGSTGRLRAGLPTIAGLLRRAGYRTYACVNSRFFAPRFGIDRGFETYDLHPSSNDDTRPAREVVRRVLAWARTHRDGPSFLFVHLFDPHLDYVPPHWSLDRLPPAPAGATIGDRFEPASEIFRPGWLPAPPDRERIETLYDAEVAATDAAIGTLLRGLVELGILDGSVLVVTADHGEEFWDHGGFEHGHTLHGELLHVPLLARLPGGRLGGTLCDLPARHIDLLPTILELAGLPVPPGVQGSSLLGRTEPQDTFRGAQVAEFLLYGPERKAIREGRDKLVVDEGGEPLALYDLESDPGESSNLLAREPGRAARLRADLQGWVGPRGHAAGMRSRLDPEILEILRSLGYLEPPEAR